MTQLPLPFIARPRYEEADFIAAPSNAEALAWLGRPASWPSGRLVLWGGAGAGKTHLLQMWARRSGAETLEGGLLRGWPALPGPVAVDEADEAPAEPLLHLLNSAAERRMPVLLAARLPPAGWPVRLPDLASRLRAAGAARLRPPDDLLLRTLLARLLADRQLSLPAGLDEWLLARLPREPAALRGAVARLDRTLAGRRISRGAVASVLEEA